MRGGGGEEGFGASSAALDVRSYIPKLVLSPFFWVLFYLAFLSSEGLGRVCVVRVDFLLGFRCSLQLDYSRCSALHNVCFLRLYFS